jgi:HEAT repeat protein
MALGTDDFAAAMPYLCTALRNEDWWVRWRAAEAMGIIGDVRAVEALCHATNDDRIEVRLAADEALTRIGSSTPLPNQILEHDGLTTARKLDVLQLMGRTRC